MAEFEREVLISEVVKADPNRLVDFQQGVEVPPFECALSLLKLQF